MPTRTVTGTVLKADGSGYAGGVVSFYLVEAFETPSEVYPAYLHTETCDANGAFSTALGVPETGTAHYEIITPDNATHTVYLEAGPATTLEALLIIASNPVDQDAVQDLIDADSVLTMTTKTTTYIIQAGDEVILCNGTFTVTLPAATGSGVVYLVKNIGTGTITLAAAGGETIDGEASQTIYNNEFIPVIDAAAAVWYVI